MPRSFLVRDDNNATCNGAGVVGSILRLVTTLSIQTLATMNMNMESMNMTSVKFMEMKRILDEMNMNNQNKTGTQTYENRKL